MTTALNDYLQGVELAVVAYAQNLSKGMDPAACLRETWNYAPAEKADQPQDY